MIIVAGITALILGWSLGKNNLSNLFGTAVGTRMIPLASAACWAAVFILIGAFFSSSATTSSILKISDLKTAQDIIVVTLSAIVILELLSHFGIPASIVQTIVGSLVGWNIYHRIGIDWLLIRQLAVAWLMAPCLAAIISWSLMRLVHRMLHRWPISLFNRYTLEKYSLLFMGMMASYTLGANNIGTITGPYLEVFKALNPAVITFCVCLAIGIGCFMADKKVIATVGQKLFPLSPMEALIVMIGTTVSMFCFSMQSLRLFLTALHLPTFPLVPIPVSSVMIGSICGIALTKGGYGLRFPVLGHIILSWFLVPIASAGFCYLFLLIGR